MVPSRILTWVLVSLNYYTDGLNHSATKAGLLTFTLWFWAKANCLAQTTAMTRTICKGS